MQPAGPIDGRLTDAGIDVVCLDQTELVLNPSKFAAAIQGLWNRTAAEALGDLLVSLPRGRTVVHVHGWAKALSPSIAEPIAASGLPAVYTMHEYFLLCPNGGFYNYQDHAPCGLEPMSARCWGTNCDSRSYPRKLWRNTRQAVMSHVARLPDVFGDIILISKFQHEKVGRHLPSQARITLVGNPISAVDLGPKTAPATGDFVYVGRLSPEKGVHVFAEAARRVGVRPVLIGDGPIRAELQSRFPEAIMPGWQDGAQVAASMRAARAIVFPSLWYEGQPLTVLEAQAAGTPVIVSDGCAGRDAVTHERTGLWFQSGSVDDLAVALIRLQDDETVSRMSAEAHRNFWSNPPTVARHAEALMTIYRRMTGTVEGLQVVEAARVAA